MNILSVAYYEFIKKIRDIKFLAIMIVAPIVLIFILGTALNTVLMPDDDLKLSVGYVNNDQGIVSQEFNKYLENENIKKLIELKEYNSFSEAEHRVEDGVIDLVIYLRKGLSENVMKGIKSDIIISGNENIELARGIINNFTSGFNTVNILLENGIEPRPDDAENLKRISLSSKEQLPAAVDYYSVVSMLQFLLIGSIFGLMMSIDEYESDLNIRFKSLPISNWELMVGNILGSGIFIFGSGVIVILFSKYVYNANWDGNWFIILGTIFVFSIISIGLGILIGRITKNFASGMGIVMLMILFFTTASGGFSPGLTLEWLSKISPNCYAKTLIFGTLYGYPADMLLQAAAALVIFSLSTFGLVFISGRGYKNASI